MKTAISTILAAGLTVCSGAAQACVPYIEEQQNWQAASFRPHSSAFERCEVDEAAYRRVIKEWLKNRAPDAAQPRSLSLGRAVSYPWLSKRIADTGYRFIDRTARVAAIDAKRRDLLARQVFADPALLELLAAPFSESPYRVTGVSYEKVLFGRAMDHTSGGEGGKLPLPYDAQLWLRLTPR